jgi:TatD DNase family protein
MLIDTHCHLTYPELAPQIDAVLRRAADAGVQQFITVATSPADARSAIALMADRPQILLAAGVHPHEAGRVTEAEQRALRDLHHDARAADGRLVAVGETGLDFHYDFATPERQEQVFRLQIELALEVGRPIIIHARESEPRVCDILSEYDGLADRVVFHCFSGGAELARRALDLGFWLSFTGVVTFRNADSIREAARLAPRERIMVETDAPYLSPEPVRKMRPCEPAFVAHTARFLAELRGERFEDFAAATTANAERFFGLGRSPNGA